MASVLFIDGGMTFPDHGSFLDYVRTRELGLEKMLYWKHSFADELEDSVIPVPMPCKENASYDAWAITFERYLDLVDGELVLVGFSLGGIFLAKYLSERDISSRVVKVVLVAPPFDDTLSSEPLTNGFVLGDLSGLSAYEVTMFFSTNDTVVPLEHAEKFRSAAPSVKVIVLDAADHFIQESFPELIDVLSGSRDS